MLKNKQTDGKTDAGQIVIIIITLRLELLAKTFTLIFGFNRSDDPKT